MRSILVSALFFLLLSSASGELQSSLSDEDTQAKNPDSFVTDDTLTTIAKRDLEFNQYVPAYRLRGEPSCEELRTMWRLSKREARRATSTNHFPRSRPYSFGRLMAFAPSHSRQFVYGEPRNFASKGGLVSPVKGSFNKLMGMIGSGGGRPGSFSRLRGIVANQRLPGQTSKGKYNELRDMVLDYHLDKSAPKEVLQVSPSLRSSDVYQPVRRALQYQMRNGPNLQYDDVGAVKTLLQGEPVTRNWRLASYNFQNRMSCLDVQDVTCNRNSDCACTGQYRCSNGRCKGFPMSFGRNEDLILRKPLLVEAE